MPFVPTPGVAQATMNYTSNDNTHAINRLYLATATTPTMTDLEEIGDALYDLWDAQVMVNTQADWSLTGIHVRAMNVQEGIQYDDENTYPVQGSLSETVQTPSQLSYTVTLNTGLVGRSARGRVFAVGVPVGFQQGNRLTDAAHGQLLPVSSSVRS